MFDCTMARIPAKTEKIENKVKALITFTGFQDPYSKGLQAENEQSGPILSLLAVRPFDCVILFSTPNTVEHSASTEAAICERHPNVEVTVVEIALKDPTNYLEILRGLRTAIQSLDCLTGADVFVSVASGTPQMHAVWILLVSSGEIPARILHIRPPRFVTRERPIVSEVDLSGSEFPVVHLRASSTVPEYVQSAQVSSITQEIGIVGEHPVLLKAIDSVSALAESDVPILILGETGTGKELFAKLVHRLSGRAADRFVALNCAALPKELAESILFGHKRGAFSGAVNDQLGKFEIADGGTLFLDELAELPLESQAKLLRVIEDGVVESIGVKKGRRVNVRIVAATNVDLAKAVKQKRFRDDLYFRLNVGQVRLPPLRERISDIPKLALTMLNQINETIRNPKRLSIKAIKALEMYGWPGNVRELGNVIERAALLTKKEVIDAGDLDWAHDSEEASSAFPLPEFADGFSIENYLADARKQLVARALELSAGNRSAAARMLGVSPQAIHKFLGKSG